MKGFDVHQNMIESKKIMVQNLEAKIQLQLPGWNAVGISNLPHTMQSKVINREMSQPSSVETLQKRNLVVLSS